MKTCRDSRARRLNGALGAGTAFALVLGPSLARAHGALGAADELPLVVWIVPAILVAIGGVFLYRMWRARGVTPEQKQQALRLQELEHALRSNQSALRNAEDYPEDYGLSVEERDEKLSTLGEIERLIEQARAG